MAFFLKEKFMNIQSVILFDGVCNFCNAAVNFVIRKNKRGDLRYAAVQTEAGKRILQKYGMDSESRYSFIFVEDGKAYLRSTAALKLSRHLKGLWPLCYGFMVVPVFIRDGLYNWIARNRYQWFGGRKECMVPSAELRAKFLT